MDTRKGFFLPFYLEYGNTEENNEVSQAQSVLELTDHLLRLGYEEVGLIYSANKDQRDYIKEQYKKNQWKTAVTGRNQAGVIQAIDKKLDFDYYHLQGKLRILPITTCGQTGIFLKEKTPTKKDWIDEDLKEINHFLNEPEKKRVVLGWQNQDTSGNKDKPFAIGGGVVGAELFSEELQLYMQENLKKFQKDYPQPKEYYILTKKVERKGCFYPVEIHYKANNPESIDEQARQIIEKAKECYLHRYPEIGLIFSSNKTYFDDIKQFYQNGNHDITNLALKGTNQTQVVMRIIELLKAREWRCFRCCFKLLPIPTCQKGMFDTQETNPLWLQEATDQITQFIHAGGAVLGWQNQYTVNRESAPFAIGEGKEETQLNEENRNKIQNALINLSILFPVLWRQELLPSQSNEIEEICHVNSSSVIR